MEKSRFFRPEEVTSQIVDWLKKYAKEANTSGFVVGISGGIDSAVTSALCAKTGLEVLCLEMPINQATSHVDRAKEHICKLKSDYKNISSIDIDLTSVFEVFKDKVSFTENNSKTELSLANSRSRLRMTTLYYFAGIYGFLVVGTGNKIEDFGVGFCTKYGDSGVDLSPIADLMKSEVYLLGNYLNISKSILEAVPTDGLFGDERTDEQQLGASYDELEWAMIQEEHKRKPTDFLGRQKEVFEIYKRLNTANKHKMSPIPICKINDCE